MAEDEALPPPADEPAELDGCEALELESLLGLGELPDAAGALLELLDAEGELALGEAALEPPEAEPDAEPDLALSLELEALGGDALGEAALELEEPGVEGEVAPPLPPTEAEPEAEPDAPGVVALEPLGDGLGDEEVLELEEPGAVEVRLELLLSHAARPNATATANASVESFMYFLRGWDREQA